MDMEILKFVLENEHLHFTDTVPDSDFSKVTGIAKLLIDNEGDLSSLSEKQQYVIKPLLDAVFNVPCHGVFGSNDDGTDTCTGTGLVDEESLMGCYFEDDFKCQFCQYDAEKIRDA